MEFIFPGPMTFFLDVFHQGWDTNHRLFVLAPNPLLILTYN